MNNLFLLIQSLFTVPNLLLAIIILVGLWILRKAQDRPEFEIGHMLLDEQGKPSSSRFAVFICLGLTSYLMARVMTDETVSNDAKLYMFLIYTITWASSKSIDKAIDAYLTSKSGQPPPQYQPPYPDPPRSQPTPWPSGEGDDCEPTRADKDPSYRRPLRPRG